MLRRTAVLGDGALESVNSGGGGGGEGRAGFSCLD